MRHEGTQQTGTVTSVFLLRNMGKGDASKTKRVQNSETACGKQLVSELSMGYVQDLKQGLSSLLKRTQLGCARWRAERLRYRDCTGIFFLRGEAGRP